MPHERDDHPNESSGGFPRIAENSLGAAQGYLEASAAASRESHGGEQTFSASAAAALQWADDNGAIITDDCVAFMRRAPTAAGQEHQCWFNEGSNRWFKATYPDRFGLGWGRDGKATATEYFTRLVLQNYYFGDDIRLVAFVNCGGHLRVLTSQPNIAGEPAPYAEIQWWFTEVLKFNRLEVDGRIAWYQRKENLLVADAHEGNVFKTPTGAYLPIDLNLIQPSTDLLQWVLAMIPATMDEVP